jgi:hypothetical protein
VSTFPKLENTRVLDAERRARYYWFVDGLPQILGGIALVPFSVALWYFASWSVLNFVIGFISLCAFFAISLRSQQLLEWLKLRATYPRTGYAPAPSPRPADHEGFLPPAPIIQLHINSPNDETADDLRRARLSWLESMLLSVPAGFVVLLWDVKTPWICLFYAIFCSLLFWWVSGREKKVAWAVVLGLPFVGLIMFFFPVSPNHRLAELAAGMGVIAIIEGTVTLVRYLRRNPVAGA